MKLVAPAVALFWVGSAFAQTNTPAVVPDCVSIYRVPLVCPAAPQIGCGSRAKPILLSLEHQPEVESAWLNRSGTLLAVVWKAQATSKQRSAAFKRISESQELAAKELKGQERKKSLADFSGGSWVRGSDVDRLSEEEAGIMAGRLIRRIRGLVQVTDEQARTLREDFTAVLKRRLTGELTDRESVQEEMVRALRQQLSEKDVRYLQEVLKDYRPGRADQ